MGNDTLLELIATACELMNHSFAPPADPASARMEFYHQFRKLWDRGIPVGMGLGHLLMKADGDLLVIERIAEKGVAREELARIAFGEPRNVFSQSKELRHNIDVVYVGNRWRILK